MSSSSRQPHGENEAPISMMELPVFVTPNELIFAANKKRSLLTVFNPYSNAAQFRIMTTSPDRFDVSVTKGTIKPNRRIDITIRLLSKTIDNLPAPTNELQAIDYFRITLQVGPLKGNKPIKVHWCSSAELLEAEYESQVHLLAGLSEDKNSKLIIKPPTLQLNTAAPTSTNQRSCLTNQRPPIVRPSRPADQGSNINLVCTICAIVCVATLFLPLSIDSELCKKVKTATVIAQAPAQPTSLLSQLTSLLSVSYEMKIGCSFALGLFTYRIISTLPD